MKRKYLVAIMIIFLLVFVSVAILTTNESGYLYDEATFMLVDDASTPMLNQVMDIISVIGSSEVILLLTFGITAIFLYKRDWFHTLFFLTISVGGVIVNFVLKVLFQRERPGEMSYIEAFNFSIEIPSYSFPSGHTMRSTILLLFLIYLSHRFIKSSALKVTAYIACILLMIGVALSRIFLDAHFLSDIVAAISISIVWFCLCLLVFNKYKRSNTIYR